MKKIASEKNYRILREAESAAAAPDSIYKIVSTLNQHHQALVKRVTAINNYRKQDEERIWGRLETLEAAVKNIQEKLKI